MSCVARLGLVSWVGLALGLMSPSAGQSADLPLLLHDSTPGTYVTTLVDEGLVPLHLVAENRLLAMTFREPCETPNPHEAVPETIATIDLDANRMVHQTAWTGPNPWTADGSLMSDCAADGSQLWFVMGDRVLGLDVASGKTLSSPEPQDIPITALSVSADGSRLALAVGKHVLVWNTIEKNISQTLEHTSQVNSVDFHPDGQRLMTATDESCHEWNAATGKGRPFPVRGGFRRGQYSHDGGFVLGVGNYVPKQNGGYQDISSQVIWDISKRDAMVFPRSHSTVAVGPASLFTVDEGRTLNPHIGLGSLGTHHMHEIMPIDQSYLARVPFPKFATRFECSLNGKWLLAVHGGEGHIWYVAHYLTTPENPSRGIREIDFPARQPRVLARGADPFVRVVQSHINGVRPLHLATGGKLIGFYQPIAKAQPEGEPVPKSIVVIDLATRIEQARYTWAGIDPTKSACTADGSRLVVVDQRDGYSLDLTNGTTRRYGRLGDGPLSCVALSPDGSKIATASGKAAYVHDLLSDKRQWNYEYASDVVWLAFSPDGKRLAVASEDQVQQYDLTSGKAVGFPFADYFGRGQFSPSGTRFLAEGGSRLNEDGVRVPAEGVRVLDMATGELVFTRPKHGFAGLSDEFLFSVTRLTGDPSSVSISHAQDGTAVGGLPFDPVFQMGNPEATAWLRRSAFERSRRVPPNATREPGQFELAPDGKYLLWKRSRDGLVWDLSPRAIRSYETRPRVTIVDGRLGPTLPDSFNSRDEEPSDAERVAHLMTFVNLIEGEHGTDAAVTEAIRLIKLLPDSTKPPSREEFATLLSAGEWFEARNQPDAALDAYLRAESISDTRGMLNLATRFDLIGNIAYLHRSAGRLVEATECYRRALELHGATGITPDSLMLDSYATLLVDTGTLEEAVEQYKDQWELARKEHGDASGKTRVSGRVLARLYDAQGETEAAEAVRMVEKNAAAQPIQRQRPRE